MAGKGGRAGGGSGGSSKGSRPLNNDSSNRHNSVSESASSRKTSDRHDDRRYDDRRYNSRPSNSRPNNSYNHSRYVPPHRARPMPGTTNNYYQNTAYGDSYAYSGDGYGTSGAPAEEYIEMVECVYCGTKREATEGKCGSCGSAESFRAEPVRRQSSASSTTTRRAAPTTSVPRTSSPTSTRTATTPVLRKTIVLIIVACVAIVVLGVLYQMCFGTHTAGVGDRNSTKWFDFTVDHVEVVDTYTQGHSHYNAPYGYKAVVVDMTLTNTTLDSLPFYHNDFLLIAQIGGYEDELMPIYDGSLDECFSTSQISMFEFDYDGDGYYAFYLAAGKTIQSRLVFVVDSDATDLRLSYTEYDSYGDEHDTFVVKLD